MDWTNLIEEERRVGNQSGVDICTAIRRSIEVQYPILSDFLLLQEVCSCHMEQYPHAPPPFLGPAYFQLHEPEYDSEDQDQWNERMLRQQ